MAGGSFVTLRLGGTWVRVIPVIDLKGRLVVRGVAGQRSEYRPWRSRLCPTADPLELADSFRTRYAFSELYLADLDAIAGAEPAWALYASLQSRGFRLWVDAGVRTGADGGRLAAAKVDMVVAGLETVQGPDELQAMIAAVSERIVFSLDLNAGRIMAEPKVWRAVEPAAVAAQVIALGIQRLIILDLARVGNAKGTGTEELCASLASKHPEVELIAGGGIRDSDDLARLEQCGVSAALVASALHEGTI